LNGAPIMAYEAPCSFWMVVFDTLEDLMAWATNLGQEVIIEKLAATGTDDYWLQDCKTKLGGSIEIYDTYRE